jgi:hypothetical protein
VVRLSRSTRPWPESLALITRRLNANHDPAFVQLCRNPDAPGQFDLMVEQAIRRVALDLLSGPFGIGFRGLIHVKSFRGSGFRRSHADGRTICWVRLGGGNHATDSPGSTYWAGGSSEDNQSGEPTKKDHAEMRLRMAFECWLISPAMISRQCRPFWLSGESYTP